MAKFWSSNAQHVMTVNSTVLYTLKVLRDEILNVLPQRNNNMWHPLMILASTILGLQNSDFPNSTTFPTFISRHYTIRKSPFFFPWYLFMSLSSIFLSQNWLIDFMQWFTICYCPYLFYHSNCSRLDQLNPLQTGSCIFLTSPISLLTY